MRFCAVSTVPVPVSAVWSARLRLNLKCLLVRCRRRSGHGRHRRSHGSEEDEYACVRLCVYVLCVPLPLPLPSLCVPWPSHGANCVPVAQTVGSATGRTHSREQEGSVRRAHGEAGGDMHAPIGSVQHRRSHVRRTGAGVQDRIRVERWMLECERMGKRRTNGTSEKRTCGA